MKRLVVLLLLVAACGSPPTRDIDIVGTVVGKVETGWKGNLYLVDLPREHVRCLVGPIEDGIDCWSTAP